MFATVDDASRSSSSSTASLLSDFVSGERYPGSPSTWKGKQKSLVTGSECEGVGCVGQRRISGLRRRRSQFDRRDEGPGATDGIVLPMQLVGTGIFEAYALNFLSWRWADNVSPVSIPFPYEWALAHKISPSKWTPDLVTW